MKTKVLFLLFCLIFGLIIGLSYVHTSLYDFFNYKYYTGWAFLNNRIGIDFLPAMFRTYFNPILNVLNFILINKLNNFPHIFLAISSLKLGIFIFLTYLLVDCTFVIDKFKKNFISILTIILVGLSPVVLFVSDFSHTDLITGSLILLA